MENAPAIILFWCFNLVIFTIMVALMVAAIILMKKGKRQNDKKMLFLGKICLTLSVICATPIIFVIGYILYIYIGVAVY